LLDKDTDERLSLKTVIALMADIETRLGLADQMEQSKQEVGNRVEDDGDDDVLHFHHYKSSREKHELERFGLI
jgi:hypothetical protein